MRRIIWFEVWAEMSSGGDEFVVLRGYDDGTIEALDPHQDNAVRGTFHDYTQAASSFADDEFQRVQGRVAITHPVEAEPLPLTGSASTSTRPGTLT